MKYRLLAATLLVGCVPGGGGGGGGNNNGNEAEGNGAAVGGVFFGGGEAAEERAQGAGNGGDSENDTPELTGGGSTDCYDLCEGLVGCIDQACDLGLGMVDRRDAEAACARSCEAEASAREREDAAEALADGCAEVFAVVEEEGLCEDIASGVDDVPEDLTGGDVTDPPETPASSTDCQAFCDLVVRCCVPDGLDCDGITAENCAAACPEIPASVVRCVAEAPAELSCEETQARCAEAGETTVESGAGNSEQPAPLPDEG